MKIFSQKWTEKKTNNQPLTCVVSVSVGLGSKERQSNGILGSRPIFRAGKASEIPFLGLSLFRNPTETLATQACLGQKEIFL